MSMPRIVGLVLAVVGVVLLIMGLNATESFSETVHEGITGRFTDKTTWFIVGGIAAIVGGGALAATVGKRSRS